jgi:hypothetical protein
VCHPPTYNQHCSAPFFRALVVEQPPSLLGRRSRRRHLISLRQALRAQGFEELAYEAQVEEAFRERTKKQKRQKKKEAF